MSEYDKLLEELKWTTIFTEKELRRAYELGRQEMLKELKAKVRGMNVNGTCQGVITEKDLE